MIISSNTTCLVHIFILFEQLSPYSISSPKSALPESFSEPPCCSAQSLLEKFPARPLSVRCPAFCPEGRHAPALRASATIVVACVKRSILSDHIRRSGGGGGEGDLCDISRPGISPQTGNWKIRSSPPLRPTPPPPYIVWFHCTTNFFL